MVFWERMLFELACLFGRVKSEIARGVHRRHGENKHRGVSVPSSRDGAIRFSTCLEKQGSHRGHREHGGVRKT
jgi:hypothetical protein